MSRIRANTIVNGAGTGAPNFPRGAIISGISTITADIDADSINIGTGTSISSPATNTLTLGTNNLERLRISSVGRVGIGTDDPERALSVHGPNAMVQIEGTGGNGKQWSIISSDDTTGAAAAAGPGNFVIYDDTPGGLQDVLTLTGVGGSMGLGTQEPGAKLHVAAGNIKVDNGYGIDFSAAQAGGSTSNLLDNYEEGTFTPKYITTNGGDAGITHFAQSGNYTRIGNLCHISITLATSDWSTGVSGSIRITDLPFALSTSVTTGNAFNIGFRREWASDLGANITARFQNQEYIYLYKQSTTSSASVELASTDFADGGSENYIYGSGTYMVA